MVSINNTRNIKLSTLLNNEEAVRKFLKSFRQVWADYYRQEKGSEMSDGNGSKLSKLYRELAWLYSRLIIPKIEEKVRKVLRSQGKTEDWINRNLYARILGEKGEINKIKEFRIRENEQSRINMSSSYLKSGEYESDVPKKYQTTQGKGEDDDLDIQEEEYCAICEKFIDKNDETESFTGSDYIACSSACRKKGVSSHVPFHDCSSCLRFIPKSVGETCRTCQEKSKNKNYIIECFSCKTKKIYFKTKKGTNQHYCAKCFSDIPWCAYCKKTKCWGKNNNGSKFVSHLKGAEGLFFHSRDCVEGWEKEQKNKSKKPSLQQLRQRYFQKLSALSGWSEFLSEDERDGFKVMILKGFSEDEFESVIILAQNLIQTKRDDEGKGDEILQLEIQKAIQEINSKLNQEPKINGEEVDFDLVSWQNYLLDSADFDQLTSRKEEILSNIKSIRRQRKESKNLSQFREEAIQQIREELAKNPPIKNEELTNPDWENDINQVLDVLVIDQIRSKILAEIRNKRINDSEKIIWMNLLLRAYEQQNWNDHSNLFSILREIKKMRSSNFSREKESEIEAIENQLRTLNPEQFKESIEQLLNYQVKDNKLNDSNTNEEVKQAIEDWKVNPTRENLTKAEEAICQNVADNKLIEIFQEVETKLNKGNLSKKGAKKMIDKIQEIISKNDYQILAYEGRRQQVDALISKLSSWEDQDNYEEESLLPKWFWPVAIVSCLGIAVVGIALWMKGKNNRRVLTRS